MTKISSDVFTRPGRLPVVQTMVVVVEDEMMHGMPSITTELSSLTAEKEVPVKVTSVPPRTLPNLGSILERSGVEDP